MDISPDDERFYTTRYHEAFLKYVENEYCSKHRRVPVNQHESLPSSNLILFAMPSGSPLSSCDPYDLWSDDEECLTPNNVADMTPGGCDRAVRILTTARLYLNLLLEAQKNWGQIDPNLNDYDCDPMEICSTFRIQDISDCWGQQEGTHTENTDLPNGTCDIFSIIPHGVGLEASSSLGRDVIGWWQSEIAGKTLREQVVVRQFAQANNGIVVGADRELDTMNTGKDSAMKQEAE